MKLAISLLAVSCFSAITLLNEDARAERFIDTFASPLPAQALPGSQSSIDGLWVGTISGTSRSEDSASQTGLTGVLGNKRAASLSAWDLSSLMALESITVDGQHALSYSTGPSYSGDFILEYGANTNLNADLIEDGSVAFELEIDGDMDDSNPQRPVQLTVTVESNSGAASASQTIALIADGVYQIPFAWFSGVDFSDIDYIGFHFDASAVAAVDYNLIGGLRTTACLQPAGSVVADMWLDTFESPLPMRNLPGAGDYPMMWVGTWNGTTKSSDSAFQSNIFGTADGWRYTKLTASSLSNFVTAIMSSWMGTPTLSYSTGYPTSGSLELRYGYPFPLNADLSAAQAFELEIKGDLDDSSTLRPVPLTVTVQSGSIKKSATVTLLDDGMVYVPFSSFPGISFSDVDQVTFYFNATQVQAVDFDLIGGLRASACIPALP